MDHPNRPPVVALLLCLALLLSACGDGGDAGSEAPGITPATSVPNATVPADEERVTLQGTLTLDGAPLDAEFIGVHVVRDGLSAACQVTIPPAVGGAYEVQVASDAEITGCGAPGAELLLWAFVDDAYHYSEQAAPWPSNGAEATFDATFSSSTPEGATTRSTSFKGQLFDADGNELPSGIVVQALVGDTLCGRISLRYGDSFERMYTLSVSGPEAVPACDEGATLTFTLDGQPAVETAINDLGGDAGGHELDLHLQ